MEFSIAEIIAIGALILNIIVYFSRVPTRKDLNDLRLELRGEIGDVRNEVRDARNEMRNEITDLRNEMRNEITESRNEMRNEMTELRGEIGELRSDMNVRFTKLDESFTNHLMFMHGDTRQPPTQGEDK